MVTASPTSVDIQEPVLGINDYKHLCTTCTIHITIPSSSILILSYPYIARQLLALLLDLHAHLDECLPVSSRQWTIPPGFRQGHDNTGASGSDVSQRTSPYASRSFWILSEAVNEAARLQAEVNVGNHWSFQVFILVVLIGGMKQQIPTAEDLVLWIVSFRSINLHAIQNPPRSCSRSVHSVQWMFSRVSF